MNPEASTPAGFSLVSGGPWNRFQEKLRLMGPETLNPGRRAALSIALTWVPLLALSAAQGLAVGDAVEVPFLRDFAAYTRFLIAIPLLILAEGLIGARSRPWRPISSARGSSARRIGRSTSRR